MARAASPARESQRQLRVGEHIRHTLAELLLRGAVHDTAIEAAHLTVSEVRISRDLRRAVVYLTELAGPLQPETQRALERARPFLRGEVARSCHLKYAPELVFVPDTSFEEATRLERMLAAERAELDRHHGDRDD